MKLNIENKNCKDENVMKLTNKHQNHYNRQIISFDNLKQQKKITFSLITIKGFSLCQFIILLCIIFLLNISLCFCDEHEHTVCILLVFICI